MRWLITGGAGFIGCNTAARLIADGHEVVIFDNLSRPGADLNLQWLRSHGRYAFVHGDVRDPAALADAFQANQQLDVVLHLAAQVAVTTSVLDPRTDFEINALGTFNVCEAVRKLAPETILLNASTNKVYGAMTTVPVTERKGQYEYLDLPQGVSEEQPVDFHSPYGCSKGSGEQYVKDYAAIYGLRTLSFRQSCIYGSRQFGIEDQGWVAWFAIAAVVKRPITIYGDGKQVRDILFVDDLIESYLKAVERIATITGRVYNIGGGPQNVASLREVLDHLEELVGSKIPRSLAAWRPGDQRVFVSDITRARKDLGWEPKVAKYEGIRRLVRWVTENRSLFT